MEWVTSTKNLDGRSLSAARDIEASELLLIQKPWVACSLDQTGEEKGLEVCVFKGDAAVVHSTTAYHLTHQIAKR